MSACMHILTCTLIAWRSPENCIFLHFDHIYDCETKRDFEVIRGQKVTSSVSGVLDTLRLSGTLGM